MPQWAQGNIGWYNDWGLVRANAEYHGYELDGYKCGGALMSPSDLGRIFWIRATGGKWLGPCLAVDCSARKDFYANVFVRDEIAEVDTGAMQWLGQKWIASGEFFVGACPPGQRVGKWIKEQTKLQKLWGGAMDYRPELEFDAIDPTGDRFSYASRFWPFPPQARPQQCQEVRP